MVTYSMPDFWLGMVLFAVFAVAWGWFPTGGFADAGSTATGLDAFLDHAHHMVLPALTLALAYLGEYMILMRASMLDTVREDYLKLARAKGLRDVARPPPPRGAQRPAPARQPVGAELRLRPVGARSRWRRSTRGRASAGPRSNALEGPDFPVLQGLFLLFSAAVIFANLIADLLNGYLDPRVRTA